MSTVFEKILEMSAVASVVIIAVLIVRLALSKAPKKYSYILWSVVAYRLVCPVSFRSAFSLFRVFKRAGKTTEFIPADRVPITSGVSVPIAPFESMPPSVTAPPAMGGAAVGAAPAVSVMSVLTVIWCVGIAVMLIFAAISYVKTVRRFSNAVLLKDNVWQSDKVRSPLIVGIVKPKIYVPFGLSEDTLHYALAHERCHLRRLDHVVRPLAYLILATHWFNPLCWLAYFLMISDMEMSCDEAVIVKDKDIGKAYSATLLSFAANKRFPLPYPVDFGGDDVKKRIENILGWKKPSVLVSVIAVLLCAAVLVGCGADPNDKIDTLENTEEIGYSDGLENKEQTDIAEPEVWPYSYTLPEYYGTTELDAKIWEHMQMPESNGLQRYQVPSLVCSERGIAKLWQFGILDENEYSNLYGAHLTDTAGLFIAMNIRGWETIYDGVIDRYIDEVGPELFTDEVTYDMTLSMERLMLQFISGTDVCGYKFFDEETGRPIETGVARVPNGTAEAILEFVSPRMTSADYVEPPYMLGFTDKETTYYSGPGGGVAVNAVAANYIVGVEKAAEIDGELWLRIVDYDFKLPGYVYGWLPASALKEYTEELRGAVASPIMLLEGTEYYSCPAFEDIPNTEAALARYDRKGFVYTREGEYYLLGLAGGEDVWVKAEYVRPHVELFTER